MSTPDQDWIVKHLGEKKTPVHVLFSCGLCGAQVLAAPRRGFGANALGRKSRAIGALAAHLKEKHADVVTCSACGKTAPVDGKQFCEACCPWSVENLKEKAPPKLRLGWDGFTEDKS